MLAHHPHPFGCQRAISARQLTTRMVFALRQHNGFGIFAHGHHFGAEPRLRLIAGRHSARQTTAHQRHESRHDDAINQRANHHESWNMIFAPAKGEIQAATNGPEDHHESGGRQHRRNETDGEIGQRLGRHTHVIRNAIFGVGEPVAGNAHAVKALT